MPSPRQSEDRRRDGLTRRELSPSDETQQQSLSQPVVTRYVVEDNTLSTTERSHVVTIESTQHFTEKIEITDDKNKDGALASTSSSKEDHAEIRHIASQLSLSQSITPASAGQDIDDDGGGLDPATDPDRPEFALDSWLRHFISQNRDLGFTESKTGVAFRGLDVFGSGSAIQVQQTAGSLLMAPFRIGETFSSGKKPSKHILRGFNGLIKSGELLAVLGRPGSGCSTLLKSLCGELGGLKVDEKSSIHYRGVSQKQMLKEFRGEANYNREFDMHFPHLTVGQTLEFAAAVRTPAHRIQNMSRAEYSRYIAKVVMTIFGLRHTYNTKVGNDFVRGISGGERKRVSISEMVLAGSPFGAWDNSTRGLDSAAALNFIEALRKSCDIAAHANAVAIYQASQSMYDLFDKATVLYEGRQVYFGSASQAKHFFERQGWLCPPRQTTADFLTSITNPLERRTREGMEAKVPRTAEDFERYWRASPEFAALMRDLDEYEAEVLRGGRERESVAQLREQKNFRQAKYVRNKSPYMVGIWTQTRLLCTRTAQRIWNDITATMAAIMLQVIFAIILGSTFVHTPHTTDGFFAKGSVLFVSVLLSALIAILEITNLYNQRPIVEKQVTYAFYHPFAEAAAGVVLDIPLKLVTGAFLNIVLYFMTGLRREASAFFLYFLITYVTGFVMTAAFRTMAAITRTVAAAMTLSGVMVLVLIVYSGYIITIPEMHPWFSWIRWINPVFYAFEILIANEFHKREFPCAPRTLVPAYQPPVGRSWICGVSGAVAGEIMVSGDAFIESNYQYHWSHVWRNFGILLAFLVGFMGIYFAAAEYVTTAPSLGESLVFRHGKVPRYLLQHGDGDGHADARPAMTEDESPRAADADADAEAAGPRDVEGTRGHQTGEIFTWRNVVLDITIKGEERRLLDHIDGWVKPGTLTALMGVSGAGKTTLLDVLAQRSNIGVISGGMLVNGRPRDSTFQRRTGYVQQQDVHVASATVRESLQFSAMLRQPSTVSKEEKYAFVEEVIKMLSMEEFADAVVGTPGQGLNLEQRKLLTIGVELAARPKLLLFLDEPTSGLDSHSSWAICVFLRKLADSGQAILCTVHQPGAILFQQFDRLLFLAKGGKTVYFGEIGDNSQKLLGYFEGNGARKCGETENPAEYMIEVVNAGIAASDDDDDDNGEGNKKKDKEKNGAAAAATTRGGGAGKGGEADETGDRDWHAIWKASPEFEATQTELDRIHAQRRATEPSSSSSSSESEEKGRVRGRGMGKGKESTSAPEFAMPLSSQIRIVTMRLARQYWRSPDYLMAKFMLGISTGLFIGFTFYRANTTIAGMQNIIFSIFMVTSTFSTVVQQIHPVFLAQRDLYEVREQPSKSYSWVAFMAANLSVEVPCQVLTAVLSYACLYFPIVGAGQSPLRQGFVLLCLMQLFLYASAFAHMTIVVLPDEQTAASLVALLTILSLIFSGVLQTPDQLPVFWREFLYRISPFTYWISAIVSTALHGRPVECSEREISVFDPPANLNLTCGQYLGAYLSQAPGNLQNPLAVSGCRYCAFTVADQSLELSRIRWSEKWRNFGIVWAYVGFDVVVAVSLYYYFRVRPRERR